jgi:hypothetical protein
MENEMRNTLVLVATVAVASAFPALAQKPDVTGKEAVASDPGKAAAVRHVKVTAQVVGIDKASRTVSLKGPEGKVNDVVAGDDVKNFDQIKVGDFVAVDFIQALSLELQKTKSKSPGDVAVQSAAATAKPGELPAAAVAHQVTAIAKVTAVDQKAKTITLKGPRGNSVSLDVHNPEQFKVVKVGDEVLVSYTEAVAISLEPAAKK